MNVFNTHSSPANGQPTLKRSDSIMYFQNNRMLGDPNHQPQEHPMIIPQPMQPSMQIPQDVQEAFAHLKQYSFRDVYRWLKIDRQEGKLPRCTPALPHVN
jgi:hypothetical protein